MWYSDQIIWTDINWNWKWELIISAWDWNIYIMNNANLSKPTAVFDWKLVWQQRSIIYSFDSPICANWDVVPNATWYLIKFYYFANWVREDIWQTVVDWWWIQFWCLNSHNWLSPNYLYRAEVIAYNNITQSQSTHSIWARVASMRIEKKVMKEWDPWYLNETTQKADDKVTYRIRIYNDSLINLQWSWENKITITDIMPKNFIFNWNIKVRNNPNLLWKNRNTFDGSWCKPNFNENYWFDFWSSISYEPGAILKWILCPSDVIPAWWMFEITFEALVR